MAPSDPPVALVDGSLSRGGHVLPLRSAEAHYWRLERDAWEPVLDSLVDLGATAVTVYVPWEAHEVAPGRFDFGEDDPRLDLDAFLVLAEERGLDLVARPGPQINGEMTWFGYPRRLLEREDLHMRSAAGSRTVLTQVPQPIPALSYASEAFFEEVAPWLDAVCAVLARHAAPRGRLVATQVDNEMAYFFNVNAWAADYSPASLAQYRSFVEAKYGDGAALRAVYGEHAGPFAEVEPPRRYSATSTRDIPWHADWAEFRETYLVRAIDRLATMMRQRGLQDVPLFHNYPHPLNPGAAASGITTPFNLAALEAVVDFVGFDVYSSKQMFSHVKNVVSYVAGTSRFPYAPELIGGSWPWYQAPGDASDEEFVVKAAMMHGLRGWSRYMAVDRDRWLGSPVRRDGSLNAPGAQVARQANALAEQVDLPHLRREADVLLLADRDYDRLAATSVLVSFPGDFLESPTGFSEYPNDLTVAEDDLGLAQPVAIERDHRFTALSRALTTAHHSFVISDTGADPARWHEHRAVALTSFEYLAAATQAAVVDFARRGGTALIGPHLPDRDERLLPCTTLRDALSAAGPAQTTGAGVVHPLGEGRVVVLGAAPSAQDVRAALEPLELARPSAGPDGLEVVVHTDVRDPTRAVVFVANTTDEALVADVDLGRAVTGVTEVWDGRKVPTRDGRFGDDRPARSIAVYACTIPPSDRSR